MVSEELADANIVLRIAATSCVSLWIVLPDAFATVIVARAVSQESPVASPRIVKVWPGAGVHVVCASAVQRGGAGSVCALSISADALGPHAASIDAQSAANIVRTHPIITPLNRRSPKIGLADPGFIESIHPHTRIKMRLGAKDPIFWWQRKPSS
jgi:hypothetical protein